MMRRHRFLLVLPVCALLIACFPKPLPDPDPRPDPAPPPGHGYAAPWRALNALDMTRAGRLDPDYEAQFTLCDDRNVFRDEDMTQYRFRNCSNDKNRLRALLKFPDGTILFESKMSLDMDGSYFACGRREGRTNLCPTAYNYSAGGGAGLPEWRRKYVNSDTVPFVVIPTSHPAGNRALGREFREKTGTSASRGDVGVVIYNEKVVPIFIADAGPHNKIGEGSLKLFEEVGADRCLERLAANPDYCNRYRNASVTGKVVTILFPNSGIRGLTPENTNEKVREKAMRLYRELLQTY